MTTQDPSTRGEDPRPAPAQARGEDPRPAPAQARGEDPRPAPAQARGEDPRPAPAQARGRTASAAATRIDLIEGAIEALHVVGFAGASAREIGRRAGCNQALIFYHFGSVTDLLLAALDEVSARRLTAYSELLDSAVTLTDLIDSAQRIFADDLAAGHVAVLVEMLAGARATPGLGPRVAERLAPWRDVAASAVRLALDRSPVAGVIAPEELAHGVVAGFLGLELLADLDGSSDAALLLFERARGIAALLDLLGGRFAQPTPPPATAPPAVVPPEGEGERELE